MPGPGPVGRGPVRAGLRLRAGGAGVYDVLSTLALELTDIRSQAGQLAETSADMPEGAVW